jgi:beta-glucosidase
MHRLILFTLMLCAGLASVSIARGEEETCAACDRKITVTGQFQHGRGHESLTIENAPRRQEEAFREEIHGPSFAVTVPHLSAGRYALLIGVAEVDFLSAGQRAFDITCGDEIIATNLDIFAAADGAGKVLVLKKVVDFPGDALRGPLTVQFTGRNGDAKLNTFELRDADKNSLISLRASDLLNAEDASALKVPVVTSPEIWKDPEQPVDARVHDLVRRFSLAEKIQQMRNGAAAVPRLGVPAYDFWSECLHGVARAGNATVFPQAIGMAATWDEPLIHTEADVIATEARAKFNEFSREHNGDATRYHGLTFWTPNINIFRDPRWGRGQETYGEDPFLTAQTGVAFIKGLQGDDPKYIKAMACAKHFAVHSGPEPERHSFNVNPDERDLYDTYLPQFEAAVREGQVGAFMGAYNAVDGIPACANSFLLTQVLRKQWGFDGHVVSDCGAIYDIYANHKFTGTSEEAAAAAVKAGDDLCCGTDYNSLTRAVKAGLITETEIDVAVERLFKARFQLGLFDPPEKVPFAQIPISQNDTPEHAAVALKVAQESLVLLKNDGTLPLNRAQIKRIAVIGANADSVPVLLGNYNGTPSHPVTILDGIRQVAGTNVVVVFDAGCPLALKAGETYGTNDWINAVAMARSADAVIYVGGISPQLEGEEMKVSFDGFRGGDRTRIELPEIQTALLKDLRATGKPVVFVNCSGSAIAMPWAAENLSAILQAWYPGGPGGRAVADVLFGDANPSGRLPVTFYRATADLPPFDDYSMSNRTYRYFGGKPLFAFGHGLSYTKFNYRGGKTNRSKFSAGDTAKVSFKLKNIGARDGAEVVQVYFRPVNGARPQSNPALCGFARILLASGQETTITMNIPLERFRHWDVAAKKYVVAPGDYELLIGAAADDLRLRVPLKVATP